MSANKRQKRHRLDLSFSLDESAFLMFRTEYVSYEFVSRLNRLYDIRLTRASDLIFPPKGKLPAMACPLFTYYSPLECIYYFLIDNPRSVSTIDKSLAYYDKILVVVGDMASLTLDRIYADFSDFAARDISPLDLYELNKDSMRLDCIRNGVVAVDFFDFTKHDYELEDYQLALNSNKNTVVVTPKTQADTFDGYALPADVNQYNSMRARAMSPQSEENPFEIHSGRRVFVLDLESESNKPHFPITSMVFGSDRADLLQRRLKYMESLSKVSKDMLTSVEKQLTSNMVEVF